MRLYPTVFLLLLTIGCARLPEMPKEMPKLTPCIVMVTLDGKPVEGVGVYFQPPVALNSDTVSWPSAGKTDAEGMTVMKTAAHYDGVVPGEYIVSLRKHAPEEFTADGMALPAKSLLPDRYAPGKSKEHVSVTTEKKEYVFELKSE